MHRPCPHTLLPTVIHIREHTQKEHSHPFPYSPFPAALFSNTHWLSPMTPVRTCSLHSHPVPCSASHTAKHSHPFLHGACFMQTHMHTHRNSQTAFAWFSMAIPFSPGAGTDSLFHRVTKPHPPPAHTSTPSPTVTPSRTHTPSTSNSWSRQCHDFLHSDSHPYQCTRQSQSCCHTPCGRSLQRVKETPCSLPMASRNYF